MSGRDTFHGRHTQVGIEMVAHRLGERNAGFVPMAIDLIEGSIQLWIITPATLIETWQRKSGMTNVAVRASRR